MNCDVSSNRVHDFVQPQGFSTDLSIDSMEVYHGKN